MLLNEKLRKSFRFGIVAVSCEVSCPTLLLALGKQARLTCSPGEITMVQQ
jgi:hypothetical protein